MKSISVGILGATGVIGQHYLSLLSHHPWFSIQFLTTSEQSVGLMHAGYPLIPLQEIYNQKCDLLFSALPNPVAQEIEPKLAAHGFRIISSASVHRTNPQIPLLIPEINPHHLDLLPNEGGFIVAKPNCSIQSFLLPLAPLHKVFGIKALSVTTLQAISGAGKNGLSKQEIKENVIPFISSEEEKLETEPLKILAPSSFPITAHCNRVPVIHGHLACVSVSFEQKPHAEEILEIWNRPSTLDLPFAPKYPVIYSHEPDRPQPRLDYLADKGMCVTVGRLRTCPLFDWRFCSLSHNAIRGGAGGGILCAELLVQKGYIHKHE